MPSLKKHHYKRLSLALAVLAYAGLTGALFLKSTPTLILFSLFPLVITGIQFLAGFPPAFIANAVTIMIGFFFLSGDKKWTPFYSPRSSR